MTTLYKVTGPKGEATNGGLGVWHRPSGKRPGKWMPDIHNPVPCRSGYHLITTEHLLDWIGPRIWVAEFHPDAVVVDARDKLVGSRARLVAATAWDDRSARLFTADCVERVLPIFERDRPGDDRPRKAVEATRLFAEGVISRGALAAARDAARAAAKDAVGDAAWDAAWDVARAAAEDATRAVARAAAGAVAWDAARAAAWDAERQWQTERLLTYLHPDRLVPIEGDDRA